MSAPEDPPHTHQLIAHARELLGVSVSSVRSREVCACGFVRIRTATALHWGDTLALEFSEWAPGAPAT